MRLCASDGAIIMLVFMPAATDSNNSCEHYQTEYKVLVV